MGRCPHASNSPLLPHAADAPIAARPASWAGGESVADIVQKVEPSVSDHNGRRSAPTGQHAGQSLRQQPDGRILPSVHGPQVQQGQAEHTQALGSGFLIDSKGDILTNNHVVDGGTRFTVEFSDKTIAQAKLVGTDPATDLASSMSKDPCNGSPRLRQLQPIRVGDPVIAIGDPYGVGETVTSGRHFGARAVRWEPRAMSITSRPTRRSTKAIRADRCSIIRARLSA